MAYGGRQQMCRRRSRGVVNLSQAIQDDETGRVYWLLRPRGGDYLYYCYGARTRDTLAFHEGLPGAARVKLRTAGQHRQHKSTTARLAP